MRKNLPKRIEPDAVVEAVLEIRFETDPHTIPEIMMGRLADLPKWRDFRFARLPTADIPAAIRRAEANLKYQPSLELTANDGQISFRVGPQMLALSRKNVYPGWDVFGTELFDIVQDLFVTIQNVTVSRLGLRYINSLRSDWHGIKRFNDINITVLVDGEEVNESLNVNYKLNKNTQYETMCRVATADLAQGAVLDKSTVIVDVDVYTAGNIIPQGPESVNMWIEEAHWREKEAFFNILGQNVTKRLTK